MAIEWTIKVTDHSIWNDIRNWKALWDLDVRAVILRASSGASYRDPKFPVYLEQAKKVGLKVLAYHVSHPLYSPQANFMNYQSAIAGANLDGPPVLDCELSGGQSQYVVASRTKETCYLFKDLTGVLIIYTRMGWWDPWVGSAAWMRDFYLWVANYWTSLGEDRWPGSAVYTTSIPAGWKGAEPFLWQFSSSGVFPEVSPGFVDKSVGYPAFEEILEGGEPSEEVEIPIGEALTDYSVYLRAQASASSASLGGYSVGVGLPIYEVVEAPAGDGQRDQWFRVCPGRIGFVAGSWWNGSQRLRLVRRTK